MADEQTPGRDYDTRTYWSGLLGDKLDLRGTGYATLVAGLQSLANSRFLTSRRKFPQLGPTTSSVPFDVLLHVTDNDAYRTALGNLRRCVAPGGLLVLAEPLAEEPVRFVPGSPSRARRTDDVVKWLADEGWRTQKVVPMVWLLGNPIERSMLSRYFPLRLAWAAMAVSSRAEFPGYLVGAAVYPVDRALARLRFGPSSKLVLAEAL